MRQLSLCQYAFSTDEQTEVQVRHPQGLCGAQWPAGASGGDLALHTPAQRAPAQQQELAGRPWAFSSSSAEHLHVIWERVTCGSHQAEERLNQGLITVCLEGSGPK